MAKTTTFTCKCGRSFQVAEHTDGTLLVDDITEATVTGVATHQRVPGGGIVSLPWPAKKQSADA